MNTNVKPQLSFDLIVIGSGPGGQKAALQGAKAGKNVAIVEEYPAMGGGCVHTGTLPSKSFRESVYRWSMGSHGTLGKEVASKKSSKSSKKSLPDMLRLLQRRDRVVSIESQVIFDQFKRNKVNVINGRAKIISPHQVEVTSSKGVKVISAPFIIIATGTRPVAPTHLPVDGKWVHDSNTILSMKKIPKDMVMLGAGIIGCEYASMFSMAGTHVYLVDKRHEILANVDREIVDHLTERFLHQGMEVILKAETKKIEILSKKKKVKVELGNGRKIETDIVFIALGRFGNSKGLGLEELGIQTDDKGLIQVDEHFRTAVPNIYAVGDVIGFPALASTSMEQGRMACCHAFGLPGLVTMPKVFPLGIYTIPEISTVGQTEEILKFQKVDYVVGRAPYREVARGQIVGDKWGLLKLLVDKKTLKILGVHIVGDNSADLVHIGQTVMTLGGDLKFFIDNVFNYPTLAEAYKTAALNAINQIK